MEHPEIDPQVYGQLILDKAGKNIQWKKDSLFNKWCWENWTATCKRMKLDHCLTLCTKINSKWMKDLDVRQDSIKILEENIGSNLYDIGQSNLFHDTSPKARETKDKMNFWDCIKIKSFSTAKETSKKLRGSPWNGRIYLQMMLEIKDWYPRSTKNFSNSIHEKQIIQLKNG